MNSAAVWALVHGYDSVFVKNMDELCAGKNDDGYSERSLIRLCEYAEAAGRISVLRKNMKVLS